MKVKTLARRWLAPGLATVVAVVLAVLLASAFQAYQNPAHVAQWLSLLQFCR